MFGKKTDYPINNKETAKIKDRLDPDESIVIAVRQSRMMGTSTGMTPSTIFITEKRIIVRNPTMFGMGEQIQEYYYHQITSVELEKGVWHSSLLFFMPGMTEMSKTVAGIDFSIFGGKGRGVINGIPKSDAEKMYVYVRERIAEAKLKKEGVNDPNSSTSDEPLKILKTRYAKGEITKEEFEDMKKELE